MTTTTVGDPILIDCDANLSEGVFTASVSWKLQVKTGGAATVVDMLPDRAAYLFASKLPKIGSHYPYLPLCTCRAQSCKHGEANGLFIFTAEYSDENSSSTEPSTNTNPLNDLPKVLPIAGSETLPITRDKNDHGILNSAGDPIIDSVTYNTLGFKIESNEPDIPSYIANVVNHTNNAPILVKGLIIPQGVARCWVPSDWWSTTQRRNGHEFYKFKFELHLDYRNGHNGYPLDAGFRETYLFSDGAGGFATARRTILGEDGSEISTPAPLDPDSAPPGAKLEDPEPDNVRYIEVERLDQATFSVLPGVS